MLSMTSVTGKTSSRQAFTLIEILVSVAILAAGLVAIMSSFNASLSTLSSSGDRMRAAFLMKETISTMEQEGFGGAAGGRFSGADAGFSWRTEVHRAVRQSGAAVNEVVVSVWRDAAEHSVYSLATYLRDITP